MTPAPLFSPEHNIALQLGQRGCIARVVWGEMPMHELLLRCMQVEDVAAGRPTPALSRKEREAVERAIREAA